MLNSLKPASRRTGLWLALGAVLVVVVWRLCVIASQRHLLAVAAEVGSVPQFRERLFASDDGSGLVYYQETERGLGAYFCETASGKSRMLFEQREYGFNGFLGTVAWSPDNRLLACAFKNDADPQRPKREIDIYDGNSGATVLKIDAIWDSRFIWLSSSSFAYTKYNGAWLVFDQKADGNWVQRQVVNRFGKDAYLYNLTATSPHSLAWEQAGEVWTHDLTTGAEVKIWPATNTLYDFAVDADTGDFLLNGSDGGGPLTIRFRPPRLGETQGTILETNRDYSRRRGVALRIEQGLYSFTVMTGTNSEPIRFVWDGMVEDYKLAGNYLYFAGNRADETPGIWQYDLYANKVRRLVSNQKEEFKLVKTITPVVGTATNSEGRRISYHLWKPEHIAAGKQYPLIIGQTHYIWSPYQQVAPQAGYYFATVDRATWVDNIDNWPEDVLELYDIMAKDPDIDTNRVFLTAFSAEARDVIQLLDARPALCKGLILFTPGALPDLSQAGLSRMLIVGGRDDDSRITVAKLNQYQDAAARAGVPVTLIIQTGAQHIARSIYTERERTRQFAEFLSEER